MKQLHLIAALLIAQITFGQYNALHIPDTLSGPVYNLLAKDTFKQILTGNQTVTAGYNGDFWGPTLIFNKGDNIQINVTNKLNDSTTVHWHGMHLPAVMDGGPHQIIPPNTVWSPYWKVTNDAATYWYHPHLHTMTTEQIVKGLGGFIIVRDSNEAALALPRTYGVDDIPLALSSRRYNNQNQFVYTNVAYGDYMIVNGTPNPQVTLPKQMVRLRILNVETERAYNLGFSDNRNFYLIATDGGLVNTPVQLTRLRLGVGERAEILVDLGSDTVNATLDLKAYNSGQAFGFPGGEPNNSGPVGGLLNNIDFNILHIKVGATTGNAITSVPTVLNNNVYWTSADATVSRSLAVTQGNPGGLPFQFDNTIYDFNTINKTVIVGDIEKWTVSAGSVFSHVFHIHDIQFKIVARNGNANAVGAFETGWKDVMYVPINENVSFVTRFTDYSDSIHPFMYHCHFTNHEDGGLMQQFVVVDTNSTVTGINEAPGYKPDFTLFPNPASNKLFVSMNDPANDVYYIIMRDIQGRALRMLPKPELQNGLDISNLTPGTYLVELTDMKTKTVLTRKFVKQ